MDARTSFAAAIAWAALTATPLARAGCIEEPRGQLAVEAGRGDEVNVAGAAWTFPFYGGCDGWQWRGLARFAVLRGREPPPAERTIAVATFIPYARHRIAQLPDELGLYFDAGLGVSAMSHTRINSERKMSTAFQFSELAGLTLEKGGENAFSVSLRLQHISNGGIKRPNDGITFVSIVYSRPF